MNQYHLMKSAVAIMLTEERFLKIKQAVEEEQNQPEVMQELLLKLIDDLQILKGIQQEKEKPAAQSFTPYGNFSMIDDQSLKAITPDYTDRGAPPTPDLPIEEPDNSLSMWDEHLDTIPSVENLVPIPSESKGISDDTCDVPVGKDSSTFDALNDHSEILSNSNDDGTSSDDDDFEDIEYASLEEVNNVDQEEKEFDLEAIFQIQDVILREKLLNVHRLIANIEALNNNPTSDHVFKSPSLVPIPVTDSDSFFEKSDTSLSHLDNSLPEFENFTDDTEEKRSGSTTTHDNNSLPEYDSFHFENEPDQGDLFGVMENNDDSISLPEYESFHFDLYDVPSFPRPPPESPGVEVCFNIQPDTTMKNDIFELYQDECFNPGGGEIIFQNVEDDDSFTFVIRTFLPYLTYPADSSLLFSTGSEDTIFDPGSST
ncbi:hypothetical protein Tco_0558703 [Tanacetum coccineum]